MGGYTTAARTEKNIVRSNLGGEYSDVPTRGIWGLVEPTVWPQNNFDEENDFRMSLQA